MSSLCSLLLGLLKHQRCYFRLLAHQRAKRSFHVLSFVSSNRLSFLSTPLHLMGPLYQSVRFGDNGVDFNQ